MRVFEGGVGCTRGGILERSMLKGLALRETGRDSGGEVGEVDGVVAEDILKRLCFAVLGLLLCWFIAQEIVE
jgi:hypothetical protein